jgi:hypothetical protein
VRLQQHNQLSNTAQMQPHVPHAQPAYTHHQLQYSQAAAASACHYATAALLLLLLLAQGCGLLRKVLLKDCCHVFDAGFAGAQVDLLVQLQQAQQLRRTEAQHLRLDEACDKQQQ